MGVEVLNELDVIKAAVVATAGGTPAGNRTMFKSGLGEAGSPSDAGWANFAASVVGGVGGAVDQATGVRARQDSSDNSSSTTVAASSSTATTASGGQGAVDGLLSGVTDTVGNIVNGAVGAVGTQF